MTLAPWRPLIARALHHNRSDAHSRYFQIATVHTDGRPANRTVVFRGFLDDGTNRLQFITDLRSDKIDQIYHQQWAEVCWYFTKTREQFRIMGRLEVVTADSESLQTARINLWQQLSDSARLQFVWPHPGEPRADQSKFTNSPAPDETNPPDNFGLVLLSPTAVDHLQLRGEPQNRDRYFVSGVNWQVDAVNP